MRLYRAYFGLLIQWVASSNVVKFPVARTASILMASLLGHFDPYFCRNSFLPDCEAVVAGTRELICALTVLCLSSYLESPSLNLSDFLCSPTILHFSIYIYQLRWFSVGEGLNASSGLLSDLGFSDCLLY